MKADESRSPLPAKHQFEHAVPTVIHHPEDDLPLLARWFHRALEHPARFWGLVAGVAVVTLALSLLGSGLTLGRAASNEAWSKLETAKTAAARVEVAKEFPNTPAERWALLQAATEFYNQGFNDLPANREAALPVLKKALDLFQNVADAAPADSPQARVAALGLARTLEARNDLDKAVKQYEKVAQNKAWAGTEEAREAERLAKLLKSPEAVAFYKDLYAFKPAQTTVPPDGIGNLPIPLPSDHPPLNGPTTPTTTNPFSIPLPSSMPGAADAGKAAEPNPLAVPPPPPTPAPKAETKGAATPESGALPSDLFTPPKADTPKPEAPKADAPKADATPGLPGEVFSGGKPGEAK